MKLLSLFTVCFIITATHCAAQVESDPIPGSTFSTSRSRIFWMGENYRKEWNTPLKVPVINLATEKGGLTPVKQGGGKQTKSLRLADASGREYTLRSIQKFVTAKTLPADLQSQAAVDLVSDGISASYPYASLSVGPLADAAGVPYGKVRLVYVPDDPRLGEYRSEFANMLATFEERLPESVSKGYDTEDVADKLEEDNDHRVDQKAVLRARILDMFVMDLDRHEDQWQFGATDNPGGKGKTFFPIPRDRDQAFYINRGVMPGLIKGRSLVPQLEGFKAQARSIERFNFAARNFDRFFLNELSEADWKSTAETFVSQMTDAVIDRAIQQQPPEIREISGPWIAQTLKERRNFLVAEVMQYYNFLANTVSITGSDKKELYTATRADDGSTTITVHKIDKDGAQTAKMYERTFNPLITRELRIYGFDGEDKFVVNGRNDKIKLRLIGGGGQDLFENDKNTQGGVIVYDRLDGNNSLNGKFNNKMSNDTDVNSFDRLGYKYNYQSIFATIGYNPDDGIFLGPTFKYIRHGFRKQPFASSHEFKASYAFSTKAVNLGLYSQWMGLIASHTDLVLDVDYRGPNGTSNFFGYGVNSVYDKSKPGKFRFYRIRYDLGDVSLLLRQRFSDKVSLTFGPTFQFYHLDSTDNLNKVRNVMLNTTAIGLTPSVFNRQSYWGAKFQFIVDTRNHMVLPERGVNWITSVRRLSGMDDAKTYDNVTQLNSDFSVYLQLIPDRLVLVDRLGGGITLGDGFEFFQAQYLGTEDNLRGYRKQRFAGRAKVYNQAELRLRLSNFRTYIFNGAMGMHAFVDAGRVYVKDDGDDKMFAGYGLGFWFSPMRRIVLTLSYAMSKEDKIPMVGLGWKIK